MLDSRVMRASWSPAAMALIGEPGGLIGEQARGFDFRGHVGQLELDGLKIGDGLAELLALLGVFHRAFVGALRHSQAERCDRDSAAVENLQAVDEPLAFFAKKIFGRARGNR